MQKQNSGFSMPKIKNKVAHPPFKLNWRRPETCKKKVPPATQLSYGNSCTCRSKKTFHSVFHALCRQHTFRDPSYLHVLWPKWPWQVLCCKHLSGFQFTSYIPACLSHSHQPNFFVSKLQKPAEALQKIKTFPTGKPFEACIPVWHKNTSASNCKPHCFNTRFVSSRFQMLLFRGKSNDREFPSNKYLETLSMIPFHDLSASDSTCAEKILEGRS